MRSVHLLDQSQTSTKRDTHVDRTLSRTGQVARNVNVPQPTRRVCMQLTQLVIKDGVVCVTQHETAPIYHV